MSSLSLTYDGDKHYNYLVLITHVVLEVRINWNDLTTPTVMAEQQKPVRRDPWARYEAWRYAPEISRRANFRRMLPGFWWGVGAFLVLCAVEEFYWKPTHPRPESDHTH